MQQMTRRDLLKAGAGSSLAMSSLGFLYACGSSPRTTTQAHTPRHGGTLRLGLTGGSSADTLSGLTPISQIDDARTLNLYEPLATMTPEGVSELYLAKEITPNATATVWTLRLKPGIHFHNGKELTAEDVIYTFKAILNPKSPGGAATLFSSLDVPLLRKRDKYTVELPFKAPFASLLDALAAPGYGLVLPVGYDPKKPVGTGPFKFESFSPGRESTFVRNSEYWQSGLPYVEKLVITDYADQTSMVNALVSGQVDVVSLLAASDVSGVTGGGKQVLISDTGSFTPFVMRADEAPFSDVRVMQAMRLIVDRNQLRNVVFGGHGSIGNDVFGITAPEYDKMIPQREQDIDKAKSLLKAAGQSDLTIQLVTSDIAQGVVDSAQIFAQQAKTAGVTVRIRQLTPSEFFGPSWLKWQFSQDWWFNYLYLPQVALTTQSKAQFNETHFSNPRYDSLYRQAQATLDTSKRHELEHEMMTIDYNEGGYIIPGFVPVIDGFGSNVHGLRKSRTGVPLNEFNLKLVWFE